MPGTVYTVASGKGGVGKTTTSVNLAVALWQEGNAVALVDADIGMANLAAVLDIDPEVTLHDVLAGRATVEEAVIEAKDGDLLVLPGDRALEGFADADPDALGAVVGDVAERVDYVIVDTGAGLSYEDVLPLGMADGVLLVTTPDPAAFGDTRKTLEVAGLLGAPIRGLVVTRAVGDTDPEAIASEIGAELLGAIPEDPAVMASTVAGDPLESYAPDSDAAAAYRHLAVAVAEGDEGADGAEPRASEPAAAADADVDGTAGADEGESPEPAAAASADPGGVEADEGADSTSAPEADEPAEGSSADGDEPGEIEAGSDEASAREEDAPTPGEEATAPAEEAPAPEDDVPAPETDASASVVDEPATEADVSEPGDEGASGPAGDAATELAEGEATEPADETPPEPGEGDDVSEPGVAEETPADVASDDEAIEDASIEDEEPEPEEPVGPDDDTPEAPSDDAPGEPTDDGPDAPTDDQVDDLSDVIADADASDAPGEDTGAPAEAPDDEADPPAEADGDEAGASAGADDEDAAEESVAETAEPDVDGASDDGGTRGGLFGWLGRLFS